MGQHKVVFFFGGQSSEHGVSCLTAAEVLKAVDLTRFAVHAVGIAADGTWVRYHPDEVTRMRIVDGVLPHVETRRDLAVLVRSGERVELATCQDGKLIDEVDVDAAFALLHGPFGEDGTIQGYFEMLGLPYVGSGVAASAAGIDKHLMKVLMTSAGIPVGPHVVFTADQWNRDADAWQSRIDALGYPVFVKPARAGSSLGISRVTSSDNVAEAVALAISHDPKVIVEQGIAKAKEVECAVLGGRDSDMPRVSELAEIVMHVKDGFYDFEAKYLAEDQVDVVIPADLPHDIKERVHDLARQTFVTMGAEGLARVDTFVLADGSIIVNEINTMPGFTQSSGFPQMWQASGLSYTDLITDLIEQALERGTGLH